MTPTITFVSSVSRGNSYDFNEACGQLRILYSDIHSMDINVYKTLNRMILLKQRLLLTQIPSS